MAQWSSYLLHRPGKQTCTHLSLTSGIHKVGETTESTQLSSDFHVHAIVFLLSAFPHPPHTHIIFKAGMAYCCLVFLLSQWSQRWYRILAVTLLSRLRPAPLFWSVCLIYRYGLCLVSPGKFYLCLFLSGIRGSITSQSEVSWFR